MLRTKFIQITSSIALNQLYTFQFLFNILHYINVSHASNSTNRSWITNIRLCQFACFAHHGEPPPQEIPNSDRFCLIFSSGYKTSSVNIVNHTGTIKKLKIIEKQNFGEQQLKNQIISSNVFEFKIPISIIHMEIFSFVRKKFKIIAHLNTKLKCLRHQSNRHKQKYQFEDSQLTLHED